LRWIKSLLHPLNRPDYRNRTTWPRGGFFVLDLKPNPTLLIVDHQKASRRLLRAVLEPHGYRIVETDNAADGLVRAVDCEPDVVILEIALPEEQGLVLLQRLREWSHVPVLVLSERKDDETKVAAFDAGATDYLTKPFSSAELLARLRVAQRPVPNVPDGPLLTDGNLLINLGTHETLLNGSKVSLTPKEQALFYTLARYAGKIVTCDHLVRSIWGAHSHEKLHDLRVLVWHLRRKLEPYGGELLVRTEGSLGYSLALCQGPEASLNSAAQPDNEAAPGSVLT